MGLILIAFIACFIASPTITAASSHPYCCLTLDPATHTGAPQLCPVHIQQANRTSTFVVEYEGFNEEAITAFEYAVSILDKVIVSDVPIKVSAKLFEPDIQNILGGGTSDFVKDFPGGIPNVWYPTPLADAITGTDTNPDSFDIEVLMNRNVNWYFGLDGDVGNIQLDFVSVVLHELGHGVGFISGMEMLEAGETPYPEAVGKVSYGLRTEPFPYFSLQELEMKGLPIIYDLFLINQASQKLTNRRLFPNPSAILTTQATSRNVFLDGPFSILFNDTMHPKVYAPAEFINGSSISHLDETLFGRGSENALMTPSLSRREVQHNPGPIFTGFLKDIGWQINPQVLPEQSAVMMWEIYH